jgi:molecular chaperone DnaJ
MNLSEAYKLLELNDNATPEEAKKQFRKLAAKQHPDVNKEPDAEEKFKKLNEAYQIICSGKDTELNQGFEGFDFGEFGFNKRINFEHIQMKTDISFKDSITGTKTELKYQRKSKCNNCSGRGAVQLHNGCKKCGGKGVIVVQQKNMIFQSTCDKCHGQTKTEKCTSCQNGTILTDVNVTVTIPGGIKNNNVLRLQGMGNFVTENIFGDQHTDVFLEVHVEPHELLTVQDMDVVYKLDVTLLEALKGCSKTVPTIDGTKQINIDPLIRNKDEVIIPNLGVNLIGNQRNIVSVSYPENIEKLIATLEE